MATYLLTFAPLWAFVLASLSVVLTLFGGQQVGRYQGRREVREAADQFVLSQGRPYAATAPFRKHRIQNVNFMLTIFAPTRRRARHFSGTAHLGDLSKRRLLDRRSVSPSGASRSERSATHDQHTYL
jgi:hypothetical protein